MTPIQASPTLNLSNDYLGSFLGKAENTTNSVKLSEINALAEKHLPRIATFFPMKSVPSMIGSYGYEALKISFESLADKTEALSKTGFSAKQISGMLSGAASHIAGRADILIKFTQPKVDRHNEAVNLPSDLEYLLNAGLSHDHISNMLLGSGEYLSENMKTLREFVTPSIQSTDAQGQPVLSSPLQVLEKAGLFKDNISNIFSQFTNNLAFGINHLLYLTYAPQNTPFNELFKEEEVYKSEMSDAHEMTQEDANDILEIFGAGKISRNNSEESFLLGNSGEMTIEDANTILEMFGVDKVDEKNTNKNEEPFLLGDTDEVLLGDRDYILDMFDADLCLRT